METAIKITNLYKEYNDNLNENSFSNESSLNNWKFLCFTLWNSYALPTKSPINAPIHFIFIY